MSATKWFIKYKNVDIETDNVTCLNISFKMFRNKEPGY